MPNPLGVVLRNKRVGHGKLVWARPDLQAPENFRLTSPDFADGSPMPDQFRGHLFGHNTSPALVWSTPPAGTVALTLVVEDADVPFGNPALHGLAVDLDPALAGLPVDGLSGGLDLQVGKVGTHRGWFGPMPIGSHGPHDYVFQLFALDRTLDLAPGFKLAGVVDAMRGHLLGRAKLVGTREKR
jgi:Raf kinase inhibitor-like YbhB/YbcL family protein